MGDAYYACVEGWAWLEVNGLICTEPGYGGATEQYRATRLGRQVRDRVGVRRLIDSQQLPESFLHPDFVRDVRPLFLQGRYDTAVFEAFKNLEVEIRAAAKLPDDLVGTALARRAFDPNAGTLTLKNAVVAEKEALAHLMAGALGSYKDPQSHRHVQLSPDEAREMILLASHLRKIIDARRLI